MRLSRSVRAAAGATAIAIVLIMLATACTGGPSSGSGRSPSAGTTTGSTSGVAYGACMRSHGVLRYPDPDGSGNLPKGDAQRYGVSAHVYQAAQEACAHLLPSSAGSFRLQVQQCYLAGNCPAALVQQMMTVGHRLAACMRSHGVPNWPDPVRDDQGRPYFDLSHHGFTHSQWHSAPLADKIASCSRVAGGGLATG
jgi:hypothetical protein